MTTFWQIHIVQLAHELDSTSFGLNPGVPLQVADKFKLSFFNANPVELVLRGMACSEVTDSGDHFGTVNEILVTPGSTYVHKLRIVLTPQSRELHLFDGDNQECIRNCMPFAGCWIRFEGLSPSKHAERMEINSLMADPIAFTFHRWANDAPPVQMISQEREWITKYIRQMANH